MKRSHALSLMIACSLGSVAHADVELIAIGRISGAYEDFALQTAAPLESGIPGNRLGGMGSGLAYAGGTTFLSIPDRGPNANPYNSAVDDTTSYITRFHTLHMSLAPSDAGAALPYTLTPMLTDTTLLSAREPLVYNVTPALNTFKTHYFVGRSDNFDPSKLSTSPSNGRFDPESIRLSNDGESVFISDEYGPYVYQFDRESGRRLRAFALPEKFAVPNSSAQGATEISGNTTGRVANKGMEALAITPDGRYLIGVMQSPLIQDGGTDGPYTRIIKIDIRTGKTREYAYPLTNIGTTAKPKWPTVSDAVAINDHELLIDERDGKGLGDNSTAVFKRLYRIDLNGAVEVSAVSGAANLAGKAVNKTLFLDVVQALTTAGIRAEDIPAKLEGITFGQDVVVNGETRHTLYIANDNDFIATVTDSNHPNGFENPNQFFVFSVSGNDAQGFVAQKFEERRDRFEDNDPR